MTQSFSDYVYNFRCYGLRGRYWDAPAYKSQHNQHLIVMIYGHHASLERNQGILQHLRHFGRVLIFDLPGFGGMESFYKIKEKPTLDNYVSFIHLFLKRKIPANQKFTLISMSLGFIMVTRLLSLHPAYSRRIPLLISLVGFLRGKNLRFTPLRRFLYLLGSRLIATRPGAFIFRYLILNSWVIKAFYANTKLAKAKFAQMSQQETEQALETEVRLWQDNDVRTWAYTSRLMLEINLVGESIKNDLHHITVREDQFLDGNLNLSDLKQTYGSVVCHQIPLQQHAPTTIADDKEAGRFISPALKALLKKQSLGGRP